MARATDQIISAADVKVSPRGRQATLNGDLLDLFQKLEPGQAALLTGSFGEVEKAKRSTVSATIRRHWDHVRKDDEMRIDYTPEGVPQVRVKVAE